jgi:subtilase family serine protease
MSYPRTLALLSCALAGIMQAQVQPRINRSIDEASLVRLKNSTHSLAAAQYDTGRADPDLPMDRLILVLKSSPEQAAALEQLLAEQQDPISPRFQQWVSPEEFGRQFGPAQQDVDSVVGWLAEQGFQTSPVAAGRRTIEFSGAVRQVEQAFHTEIHRYLVNGQTYIANSADIAIPEALAAVVAGPASLHDFLARPLHRQAPFDPAVNLVGGSHALGPYDFAAIYDLAPLWNSNFDGSGQSIAVVGRTNINPKDIPAFRSQFGLPGNNTVVVLNGKDPGILGSSEEMEADLDVEWAGAVAKGAAVKFVVSASTNSSDGIVLSALYIVDNNLAPVVSLSFGGCEASLGAAGNLFFANLWSQAAAQGMSVFVAAGDSGSAGCDAPVTYSSNGQNTTLPASQGLAVNGLASTPYNVAVGGTEFNDSPSATYWNASNDVHLASAKGYIPESVWNESSYTTPGASTNGLWSGSGGVSAVYTTPAWQTGAGVPLADPGAAGQHHRYLPDVSLAAGSHDGYLIVQEGALYVVSGTSASTPSLAGIMAILDQYSGLRNGNPNSHLYPLAAHSPLAFHDITSGTNAVPCQAGSPGCSAGHMSGYSATAGFDLATGWGSVDAYALALNWSAAPPPVTLSIASLSPNPMTGSASNQLLTLAGTGFQTGATVKATYPGYSATLQVSSITATQIQAAINVGVTARAWSVQVSNPSGPASNAATLQVNAPPVPPAIASLSPNPMTGSTASQTLTIKGSGFQSGATVQAGYTGYTVTLQVSSLSATQIQALIDVGTTARSWTVKVVNPGGMSSNVATLQVTAPPSPPAIASLSPNPMAGSAANQTLTILGSGFQSGATVQASYTGYTAALQVSSISAAQIKATINVGATARAWTLKVVNPNGQASNLASLTVTAGR